jgi:hypothetical protein
MRQLSTLAACLAWAAFAAVGPAGADEKPKGDPYPLAVCPVSGEALGSMGDPVVKVYDGREVRFCCAGCIKGYENDPATHNAQIDAAIKELQAKDYPLTTCIISGKELGAEPVVAVIGNRAVAFCCPGCPPKFTEDVAAAMAKLDKAVIAEVKPVNEGGVCPVSGQELGDKPAAKVYGTQVVAFCCEGCPKTFEQGITENLKKLGETAKS